MRRRRFPPRPLFWWPRLMVVCKRRRRRGKKSTSALENSSTTAASMPRTDLSFTNYEERFVAKKNYEEILVLFETPSGFAIFCLKEYYLKQPNIWAIFGEHFRSEGIVWLKEFRIFKDKSSAIDNGTGVSRELTEMILRYHHPCQKLAVGKPEYKEIIEKCLLGVPCLFDDTVLEVMWGLQNLMHSLVPQEKLNLTNEDRLPMSQGLKNFLYQYDFDVVPKLVNEEVLVAACLLRDTELIAIRHSEQLCWAAHKLKIVSGINLEDWPPMKIATALKIMSHPAGTTYDDVKIFAKKELSELKKNAHKYQDISSKEINLKIYSQLVEMREVKKEALEVLHFCLRSSM